MRGKIGTIKNGYVVRFSTHMIIQHFLLLTSLIILALTGFALRYHDSLIGKFLLTIEGGFEFRGIIHRFFAIILILDVIYHLWYVIFTEEGHKELMSLKMKRSDFKDFLQMLKYHFTGRGEGPLLDKYSFREKFQYWGVFAGIVIMAFTGFILWFKTSSMAVMPKWVFDVIGIIHGAEGLILFIVLFLWHAYNVHIASGKFFNKVFITGIEPLEEIKKNKPLEYRRYIHPSEK